MNLGETYWDQPHLDVLRWAIILWCGINFVACVYFGTLYWVKKNDTEPFGIPVVAYTFATAWTQVEAMTLNFPPGPRFVLIFGTQVATTWAIIATILRWRKLPDDVRSE